jgi:hypothetical protein
MYSVPFRSNTYPQTWKNTKQAPKEKESTDYTNKKTYENENRGH